MRRHISRSEPTESGTGNVPAEATVPVLAFALVLFCVTGAPAPARNDSPTSVDTRQGKIAPWVVESARRRGQTEFLVYLDSQADVSGAALLETKAAKGAFVAARLRALARDTQPPLLELLRQSGVEHRSFWVANMIWARANLETIERVAARPEVRRISANPRVGLDAPRRTVEYQSTAATSVEPNLLHTRAPQEYWALGFTGQGIVIGGQDTGYDWRHPALRPSYRGWNGSTVDHSYNWHDAIHTGGGRCGADSPEPCDDGSHGTHTMGTMVGDDGGGNRVGLAPSARWIGCRNMDEGVGTPASYAECFEWFLAPTDLRGNNPDPSKAPDIISNSWTCPESEGCTDPEVLRSVVENVRAAGILVVASAGNAGPSCSSISSPIAIYDAVLTVGATDTEDEIAGFSSRGPVLSDGSGRRKPDIAAPGVAIRSSTPGGGYDSFSGTSMAGPHVAGMAALALSAGECRRGRPRRLESHLLATALPRPAPSACGYLDSDVVPNNTYGHGALRAVLPACPGDGRVAGEVADVSPAKVVCRNRASGDRARVQLDGVPAWNCTGRGLTAAKGDRIALKVTGRTDRGDAVRGEIHGLDGRRAVCTNRSTGQRVRIPLGGGDTWDCSSAGLQADPRDRLTILLLGTARSDSAQSPD